LFYIDSNIFIYPVIYDEDAISESKNCKSFLLKIASGGVEAYTSVITWDEVTWVARRILGVEASVALVESFLGFQT
jgi:predicted nucleic acid-binding protein